MIKKIEKGLLVKIKIIPNSSKNSIVIEENFIKIKITTQPIENKANKHLIEYLSKNFKIPKSNIEIVKGELTKDKTILFSNISEEKSNFIITQLTKK